MTGEHKFFLIMVCSTLITISLVILVSLFIVWEQREWIITLGGFLLVLFCLASIAVWIMRQLSEQHLRYKRVRYQEELPLDQDGQPYYIPQEVQPYSARRNQPKEQQAYHTVEEYQYRQQQQGEYYR